MIPYSIAGLLCGAGLLVGYAIGGYVNEWLRGREGKS